jgi:vitamin B12/bleomycin/antimicrobial peptide transport system ATP-binding/permease protein
MTATSSSQPPLNELSRFDRRLWDRFVAIAQPYWYPTGAGNGKIFFLLLLLLLIFVFGLLFVLVSAVTLLSQQLFPAFMGETAGGFVALIQGIWTSPLVAIVAATLLIPLVGFGMARRQLIPRWRQWAFLGFLLFLSLSVSGLNVIISYVGNFFTTALSNRDEPTFWRFLFVYAGVFVVGIPIVVFYSYFQDLLGLFWRDWMTNRFLGQYFDNRAYYEINLEASVDNPDQRISEDIRSFTTTSLRYVLLVLGSIISVIAFSGILWSISRLLSIFLIGYALFGTLVIAYWGRRLVSLNFLQLQREADFRYGLVHVRDNAESIAFYQGERQELLQVRRRFGAALRNFNFLIGWQRNIGFFTTGYEYAIIILPSLILAPLYFDEQIQFGDITQAGFAFSRILQAFSIFILNSEIERLSAFAAGVNRLETFTEALEIQPQSRPIDITAIDTVEDSRIALEHVTLMTPKGQRSLVEDLSVALQPGQGLVIVGRSGAGKSSLLRAIAGLWNTGSGKIIRPRLENILFLPQRPYMVLGTLRDQLLYPTLSADTSDRHLCQILEQVNLANLPERVGGFDTELNWSDVLSLGEQQRLAFARLLLTQPPYAILDEATSALDFDNERQLYQQLRQTDTTFISVGHRPSLLSYHDYVLELKGDSSWQLSRQEDYSESVSTFA